MIKAAVNFILGKVAGPYLVYAVAALTVALAAESYLLKRAWTKNAQAVLKCENIQLTDANERTSLALNRLRQANDENAALRIAQAAAGADAEQRSEHRIAEQDERHQAELEAMEVAANEVPDEDYYCASERVSAGLLSGMRERAKAYNKRRAGRDTAEGSVSPDT